MSQHRPISCIVKCIICGREFTPTAPNQRYCSDYCREQGKTAIRQRWEQRTGYLEKKRQQSQEKRDRERANREAAEREAAELAAAEFSNQMEVQRKKRQKALQRAAAAGDPFARMKLYGRKTAEYWAAYRDYDLQYAEQTGRPSRTEVNGIPVTDPDFPESVVLSIQESGRIIERTNA